MSNYKKNINNDKKKIRLTKKNKINAFNIVLLCTMVQRGLIAEKNKIESHQPASEIQSKREKSLKTETHLLELNIFYILLVYSAIK